MNFSQFDFTTDFAYVHSGYLISKLLDILLRVLLIGQLFLHLGYPFQQFRRRFVAQLVLLLDRLLR